MPSTSKCFRTLTAVENVEVKLAPTGVRNPDLRNRALALLDEVGLARYFAVVVHSARKPAPEGMLRALADLQVDPTRALHVGDDGADREGAAAAGMWFAPAPLSEAVATIR